MFGAKTVIYETKEDNEYYTANEFCAKECKFNESKENNTKINKHEETFFLHSNEQIEERRKTKK